METMIIVNVSLSQKLGLSIRHTTRVLWKLLSEIPCSRRFRSFIRPPHLPPRHPPGKGTSSFLLPKPWHVSPVSLVFLS